MKQIAIILLFTGILSALSPFRLNLNDPGFGGGGGGSFKPRDDTTTQDPAVPAKPEDPGPEDPGPEDPGPDDPATPPVNNNDDDDDDDGEDTYQQRVDTVANMTQEMRDHADEIDEKIAAIKEIDTHLYDLQTQMVPLQLQLTFGTETMSLNEQAKASKKLQSLEKQEKLLQEKKSDIMGDPVFIPTGQYTDAITDYSIRYLVKSFEITRTYSSTESSSGSFGKNWISSLDQRLIFGISTVNDETCRTFYNQIIAPSERTLNETILAYTSRFGKSRNEWNTIADEINTTLFEIQGMLYTVSSDREYADWLNKILDFTNRSILRTFKPDFNSLENRLITKEVQYVNALLECRKTELLIQENSNNLEAQQANYNRLLSEAARNRSIQTANSPALFPETPEWYYMTGPETITFIDSSGSPVVFTETGGTSSHGAVEAASGTSWTPADTSTYISLVKTGSGFTLTLKDGSTRSFTQDGLLSRITDAYGNWISFSRDTSRHIFEITVSSGKRYSVTWSGRHISAIYPSDGSTRDVSFTYTGDRLSSVTDEESDTVSYTWNNGLLSGIVKPDGSSITLRYDASDASGKLLATATKDEEGNTETFDYDPARRTTLHTDHSGVKTLYFFDDQYRTIRTEYADGLVTTLEYDNDGNLSLENRSGLTARYYWYPGGLKKQVSWSDGTSEHWTWDQAGNMTSYTGREGVTYSYTWNNANDLLKLYIEGAIRLSRTYAPSGLISSETVYEDRPITTRYEYDSSGNIIKTVTGSNIQEWTWDRQDRLTSCVLNGTTTARIAYSGRTTTVTSLSGLETSSLTNARKDTVRIAEKDTITGEERVTEYEYDRRHLVTAVYRGNGQTRTLTERCSYDGEGRKKAAMTFRNDGAVILLYGYKNERNVMLPAPASICVFTVSQTDFIQEGLATREGFETADLEGLACRTEDKVGLFLKTEYIGSGKQRITVTDESGKNCSYVLDLWGTVLSMTDTNGVEQVPISQEGTETLLHHYNEEGLLSMSESESRKEWYRYDELGSIVMLLYGGNGTEESADYYASYDYGSDRRTLTVTEGGKYTSAYGLNAWGEPVSYTDGNGNTTRISYDCFGNAVDVTDPYGNITRYEYDLSGGLTKAIRADGSVQNYAYSPLGETAEEGMELMESPSSTSLVCDDAGNVIEAYDENTHLVFLYDRGGRLIKQRNITTGTEFSFDYDCAGNRTLMTDGTSTVRYEYGANNELLSVTEMTGNDVHASVSFMYDCLGREILRAFRNGVTQATSYTADGNMELTVQRDQNGRLLWGEGFLYDDDGRITATVTSDALLSLSFYDERGRLCCILESDTAEAEQKELEEAAGYGLQAQAVMPGEAYYLHPETYYALQGLLERMQTSLGNGLSVLHAMRRTEYSYDDNSNRISKTTAQGTISYEYDRDNRLTQAGNRTYLYDAEGNLLSETSPARSVEYAYSQDNRMLSSIMTDVISGMNRVNEYMYDPFGRRISSRMYELSESGALRLSGSEKTEYDGFSFDALRVFSGGN